MTEIMPVPRILILLSYQQGALLACLLLGVGHIGIHLQHLKEVQIYENTKFEKR